VVGSSDWSYRQLSFFGDMVEAVFNEINHKFPVQPGQLTHDVKIYQGEEEDVRPPLPESPTS